MATTITFDSVSLQDANYTVRSARHDSSSERELDMLSIARDDGSIFVAEKYTPKTILVTGIIKASTQANVEDKIDDLKELVSRREKNLDISYAGGTRRYVAYARNIRVERDHYHINYAPYEIEFVVPSGIGKDTSVTASVNNQSANPTYSGTASFSGSAKPKPVITLTFGANWVDAFGLSFENTDNDEKIVINKQDAVWSNADVLEIDCENKTVERNSAVDSQVNFYRVFPTFELSSNNIEIKGGDLIDQQYDPGSGNYGSNETNIAVDPDLAQSFFVTNSDDTYQGISLYVKEKSGDSGDLTIEIRTDNAGEPSASVVTNATMTIPDASFQAGYTWVLANSASKFSLTANTRYWIVLRAASGAAHWVAYAGTAMSVGDITAEYSRGNMANYQAAAWVDRPNADMFFRLHYGGKVDSPVGTLTLDIDYTKKFL